MKLRSKRLQAAIEGRFANIVDEAGMERDDAFYQGCWSYWIYLKPGWYNYAQDPWPGSHIIHETSSTECLRCLEEARRCDCDSCQRELGLTSD